jgi:hypothetical protein
MSAVEIPLTRGYMALIDAADAESVLAAGPWNVCQTPWTNYARANVRLPGGRRTAVLLHTFLTGWELVDHVDSDGLNNRRANLRPATHSENQQNRRMAENNTSGYKGVSFDKSKGRWRAAIKLNGRTINLGRFADPTAAASAYDAAALDLFGEFARLNFPEAGR